MTDYRSKTISRDFFEQQQTLRGGKELFNAAGDKINTLNSFIEKNDKKRREREAAKDKIAYAVRVVDALLKEKLEKHQRLRLQRSAMSNASKYAKIGDEINLRKELKSGYPVDRRDGVTGRTLIMEASVGGHYQLCRLLCREYKCNCNATSFLGGVTALHLAVSNNFRQITVLLIQSGVDVNLQDKQGCTALHYVQSKTILKVLLRADADPLIKNRNGLTPRQYYHKNVEIHAIDPFIIKTLRDLEEKLLKEKLSKELVEIENNKIIEEQQKKADLVIKKKRR